MKKRFLSALMLMCSLHGLVKAQDFRLGVLGGYNLNRSATYNPQSGFRTGIVGEYAFSEMEEGIYTHFGLLLSSHGWKKVDEEEGKRRVEWKVTPYYLNVPVRLGCKVAISERTSVFIEAGPFFSVGLFGKMWEKKDGARVASAVSRNVFADGLQERVDWGIGFRGGLEVDGDWRVAVGCDRGMRHFDPRGLRGKNRTFVSSLTYML